MMIADIFEALTAPDRPYKRAKTLGNSLLIMRDMGEQVIRRACNVHSPASRVYT